MCSSRHTHCAVDQAFSCHSRFLNRTAAKTIPQLGEQLVKSFTSTTDGKPTVHYLEESADVKAWLQPVTRNVNNITGSQQYLIEGKEVDGVWKAVLSCKQFAATSDDKWEEVGCLLKVRRLR